MNVYSIAVVAQVARAEVFTTLPTVPVINYALSLFAHTHRWHVTTSVNYGMLVAIRHTSRYSLPLLKSTSLEELLKGLAES